MWAAIALGHLAANSEELKALIVSAGALQPLVGLLAGGSESAQVNAAFVLRNLAHNNEQRSVQIVNAGALPPLFALFREGPEIGRNTAAVVLTHLRNWESLRAKVDKVDPTGLYDDYI